MDKKINFNRKGQVTMWIIFAIALIGVVILFFVVIERPGAITPGEEFEPRSYIERCTRDSVIEAIDIMLPQGGFIEPKNYKTFDDINVEYICDNINNDAKCINQHPMLFDDVKNEIKVYTKPKIEKCFSNLKTELEKRKWEVNYGVMSYDVNLNPDSVNLDIERKTNVMKGEEKLTIDEYNIRVNSPVYNLIDVANAIAEQESKNCYFDYVSYMIFYPRFKIIPFSMSDSTVIYTIRDAQTDNELNIAIRSCASTPGVRR